MSSASTRTWTEKERECLRDLRLEGCLASGSRRGNASADDFSAALRITVDSIIGITSGFDEKVGDLVGDLTKRFGKVLWPSPAIHDRPWLDEPAPVFFEDSAKIRCMLAKLLWAMLDAQTSNTACPQSSNRAANISNAMLALQQITIIKIQAAESDQVGSHNPAEPDPSDLQSTPEFLCFNACAEPADRHGTNAGRLHPSIWRGSFEQRDIGEKDYPSWNAFMRQNSACIHQVMLASEAPWKCKAYEQVVTCHGCQASNAEARSGLMLALKFERVNPDDEDDQRVIRTCRWITPEGAVVVTFLRKVRLSGDMCFQFLGRDGTYLSRYSMHMEGMGKVNKQREFTISYPCSRQDHPEQDTTTPNNTKTPSERVGQNLQKLEPSHEEPPQLAETRSEAAGKKRPFDRLDDAQNTVDGPVVHAKDMYFESVSTSRDYRSKILAIFKRGPGKGPWTKAARLLDPANFPKEAARPVYIFKGRCFNGAVLANMESALIQMSGTRKRKAFRCLRCRYHRGIYTECVFMPDIQKGSCGCCVYNASAAECSLRYLADSPPDRVRPIGEAKSSEGVTSGEGSDSAAVAKSTKEATDKAATAVMPPAKRQCLETSHKPAQSSTEGPEGDQVGQSSSATATDRLQTGAKKKDAQPQASSDKAKSSDVLPSTTIESLLAPVSAGPEDDKEAKLAPKLLQHPGDKAAKTTVVHSPSAVPSEPRDDGQPGASAAPDKGKRPMNTTTEIKTLDSMGASVPETSYISPTVEDDLKSSANFRPPPGNQESRTSVAARREAPPPSEVASQVSGTDAVSHEGLKNAPKDAGKAVDVLCKAGIVGGSEPEPSTRSSANPAVLPDLPTSAPDEATHDATRISIASTWSSVGMNNTLLNTSLDPYVDVSINENFSEPEKDLIDFRLSIRGDPSPEVETPFEYCVDFGKLIDEVVNGPFRGLPSCVVEDRITRRSQTNLHAPRTTGSSSKVPSSGEGRAQVSGSGRDHCNC